MPPSLALLLRWPTALLLGLATLLPTRGTAAIAGADGDDATVELLRVIDGDTLEVRLDGRATSVRVLWVDTEEKIAGRARPGADPPETVFGQETLLWARDLFASFGARARIGLAFPEGRRADAFGRLLGRVSLPDGSDYALRLVREGRSPYFTKFGRCRDAHGAFVRAQAGARAAGLGIWSPATNRARTPDAPSARRPYERLLAWWDARAEAIEGFRVRAARDPAHVLAADDAAGLRRAADRAREAPDERVAVFGTLARLYEEADGGLTALLAGARDEGLRVPIPVGARAALEGRLRASQEAFQQNHLWVSGHLARGRRGLELRGAGAADWSVGTSAPPSASGPAAR